MVTVFTVAFAAAFANCKLLTGGFAAVVVKFLACDGLLGVATVGTGISIISILSTGRIEIFSAVIVETRFGLFADIAIALMGGIVIGPGVIMLQRFQNLIFYTGAERTAVAYQTLTAAGSFYAVGLIIAVSAEQVAVVAHAVVLIFIMVPFVFTVIAAFSTDSAIKVMLQAFHAAIGAYSVVISMRTHHIAGDAPVGLAVLIVAVDTVIAADSAASVFPAMFTYIVLFAAVIYTDTVML